jgi:hypothetical protein
MMRIDADQIRNAGKYLKAKNLGQKMGLLCAGSNLKTVIFLPADLFAFFFVSAFIRVIRG